MSLDQIRLARHGSDLDSSGFVSKDENIRLLPPDDRCIVASFSKDQGAAKYDP